MPSAVPSPMPNSVAEGVVCVPTNSGSLSTVTAAALTVLAPTEEESEELDPGDGGGEVAESSRGKRKRGGSRKPTQSELRRKMTDEDLLVLFCDHLDAVSQIPQCKKLTGGGTLVKECTCLHVLT